MSEQSTEENKQRKNLIDTTFLDTEILSRFVTETGRILPRKITRLSAKEQRHLSNKIKQARNLLLMK